MGSHLLTWERGAGLVVWRGRCACAARKVGEQGKRLMVALPMVVLPALTLLLSSQVRHWLVETLTTVCVLGGFILAPILTVVAWVGTVLPDRMPLHQLSTTLFVVALVWIGAALVSAHMHHAMVRQREG